MRISDWSSDVCSSDLAARPRRGDQAAQAAREPARQHRDDPRVAGAGEAQGRCGGGTPAGGPRGGRAASGGAADRKSVVSGKSVSVRVDLGGRGISNKKNKIQI